MINGIEGQFGSGKSACATYIARDVVIKSAKSIAKKASLSGNVILSNIKMNKEKMPNYYYFEDDKFLEILRTCNLINDIERELYSYKEKGNNLTRRKRHKFTRFYIFFDEVGAIANNRNYKEFNTVISEYINQNRKNQQEIYLITADGSQTDKSLRRFVEWWYYVKPLANIPILKDIGVIRRMKKDDEGKPLMENYAGKDQNGDYVVKQKPIDEYLDWFWKPNIWNFYDDLHKNIRDKEKYTEIDKNLVTNMILDKKELLEPFQNNFKELSSILNLTNEKKILNKA